MSDSENKIDEAEISFKNSNIFTENLLPKKKRKLMKINNTTIDENKAMMKASSVYDNDEMTKQTFKPLIIQLERIPDNTLQKYVNKQINKSEGVKSNLNIVRTVTQEDNFQKIKESIKSPQKSELEKFNEINNSKKIKESESHLEELKSTFRRIESNESLKQKRTVRTLQDFYNDLNPAKRPRRSFNSSDTSSSMEYEPKRRLITDKHFHLQNLHFQEVQVYLTRLEQDLSNNPYILLWQSKLKELNSSKDRELKTSSLKNSGIAKSKSFTKCDNSDNSDVSSDESYENFFDFPKKGNCIDLNKTSKQGRNTDVQKLYKELKILLIRLEDLGICLEEKLSASEIDCLTDKYIDFLMNSNFSCKRQNVLLTKYITSKKKSVRELVSSGSTSEINNTSKVNISNKHSSNAISLDHTYFAVGSEQNDNNCSTVHSEVKCNSTSPHKKSLLDSQTTRVNWCGQSLIKPKVISDTASTPSSENTRLYIWRTAFCAELNNQDSSNDSSKTKTCNSQYEMQNWLNENQLVHQACSTTVKLTKSEQKQNVESCKAFRSDQKITKYLEKAIQSTDKFNDQQENFFSSQGDIPLENQNNSNINVDVSSSGSNDKESNGILQDSGDKVLYIEKDEVLPSICQDISILNEPLETNSMTEESIREINIDGTLEIANNQDQVEILNESNITPSKQICLVSTEPTLIQTTTSPKKLFNDLEKSVASPQASSSSSTVPCKKNTESTSLNAVGSTVKSKFPRINITYKNSFVPRASKKPKFDFSKGRLKNMKGKVYSKLSKNNFQCNVCNKAFELKVNLAKHLYGHTEAELQEAYRSAKMKLKIQKLNTKPSKPSVANSSGVKVIQIEAENLSEPSTNDSLATSTNKDDNELSTAEIFTLYDSREKKKNKKANKKRNIAKVKKPFKNVGTIEKEKIAIASAAELEKNTVCNMNSTRICLCHKDEEQTDLEKRLQIEMVLLCRICQVLFRRANCFDNHYTLIGNELCSKDRSFGRVAKLFCSSCREVLHTLQDLRKHLEMHAAINKFEAVNFLCHICNVLFFGVGSLLYGHWTQHTKNPFFVASRLSFPKVSVFKLKDFQSIADTDLSTFKDDYLLVAEHVCKNCKTPFANETDIKTHIENGCQYAKVIETGSGLNELSQVNLFDFINRTKFNLICGLCQETYQREAFENHVATDHDCVRRLQPQYITLNLDSAQKIYICNICAKTHHTLDDFQNHWTTHASLQKEYVCTCCNITFPNYEEFILHSNYCARTNQFHDTLTCKVSYQKCLFICKICHKEFCSENTLRKHFMVHSQDFNKELNLNLVIDTNRSHDLLSTVHVAEDKSIATPEKTIVEDETVNNTSATVRSNNIEDSAGSTKVNNVTANAICDTSIHNSDVLICEEIVDNNDFLNTTNSVINKKEKSLKDNGSASPIRASENEKIKDTIDEALNKDKKLAYQAIDTEGQTNMQFVIQHKVIAESSGVTGTRELVPDTKISSQLKEKSFNDKSMEMKQCTLAENKSLKQETNAITNGDRECILNKTTRNLKKGEGENNIESKNCFIRVRSLSELKGAQPVYACHQCDQKFDTENMLKEHVPKHDSNEQNLNKLVCNSKINRGNVQETQLTDSSASLHHNDAAVTGMPKIPNSSITHANLYKLYGQQAENIAMRGLNRLVKPVTNGKITCVFCPGFLCKTMLEFSRHVNTSKHIEQKRKITEGNLNTSTPSINSIQSNQSKECDKNQLQTSILNRVPVLRTKILPIYNQAISLNLQCIPSPSTSQVNTMSYDNVKKQLVSAPNNNLQAIPSGRSIDRPILPNINQTQVARIWVPPLSLNNTIPAPVASVKPTVFTIPSIEVRGATNQISKPITYIYKPAFAQTQAQYRACNNASSAGSQSADSNRLNRPENKLTFEIINQNQQNPVPQVNLQQPINSTNDISHICNYCSPSVLFHSKQKFIYHIEAEHKFICSVCGFRAYRANDLKNHSTVHKLINTNSFKSS
ncbi:uncharacterized protein [Prorops nasuta]